LFGASSPLCRDCLAADDNLADFQSVMLEEHEAGAHPEPTDCAVADHIDVGSNHAVVFKHTLNAVKSKLPSSLRKASFKATANQSLWQFKWNHWKD
jgi:hypothetical protein